jgi:hypothetical protein
MNASFDPASRARLTAHDVNRFVGNTLFDRLGRVVATAGCLPRKELYEAWEVARRVRRLFRGGRIVDIGGGHGLLAATLLLLDDSSTTAVVVDRTVPDCGRRVHDALMANWPRLAGRIEFFEGDMSGVAVEADDVVVSCHACGLLTDGILDLAVSSGARVAVLPCCHDTKRGDTGALGGWVDASLAIDIMRAVRLQHRGYRTWTQEIPATITPKNRLLLGQRADEGAGE